LFKRNVCNELNRAQLEVVSGGLAVAHRLRCEGWHATRFLTLSPKENFTRPGGESSPASSRFSGPVSATLYGRSPIGKGTGLQNPLLKVRLLPAVHTRVSPIGWAPGRLPGEAGSIPAARLVVL
jgi:hypothetical protein